MRGNFQVYNGTTKTWSANSSGLVASGATVTAKTSALATDIVYYYTLAPSISGPTTSSVISGSDFSAGLTVLLQDRHCCTGATTAQLASTGNARHLQPDSCTAYGGVGQPDRSRFTSASDIPRSCTPSTRVSRVHAAHGERQRIDRVSRLQITPNLGTSTYCRYRPKTLPATSPASEYDFKVAAGSTRSPLELRRDQRLHRRQTHTRGTPSANADSAGALVNNRTHHSRLSSTAHGYPTRPVVTLNSFSVHVGCCLRSTWLKRSRLRTVSARALSSSLHTAYADSAGRCATSPH